ncbi:hypothetical protein CAI21_11565 [Alkalilimnicola ehrlichii]|uniref:NodB homology domain-containing protein n=1 Tax=Alkalilimnicola ehrlichii TaxID=351052 RepID=A0A3E0WU45_9GAMM|nr:polysaccharide deacetylase family protein [Alkalilimnicola ehrlichii]RFA28506.1 hypothetical protein CAI21_11565 [Alkalilimnicola ehrlichii]RFA35671.1 hypothetical protein CAL65_12100 [Alkalilimnicola ehrlichii]
MSRMATHWDSLFWGGLVRRRLAPGVNGVALSFDDGPDPRYTPAILDLLAAHSVRATFFLLADQARRYPLLTRRIASEGHELGSHGCSHRHPWRLSVPLARQEVREAGRILADISGERIYWFRPPFGRLRRCMVLEAAAQGQRTVLWSRSAIDWGPWGTEAGVRRRLARVENGDVVLLHDAPNRHNRPEVTVGILPDLLRRWRETGLRSSTLTDSLRTQPNPA